MNAMQRLWATVKAATVRFSAGPWWGGWFVGSSGAYSYEQVDATTNSIVAACVRWMARTMPEAPLVVRERTGDGEWEDRPDHRLQEVLDRPNPYYSGLHLWAATVADWMFGDAYWIKIRGNDGRVQQLWWMPSWMIEPKWEGRDFISYYEQRADGDAIRWETKDIVHFRNGNDPRNPRKGLGLKAVIREVATDQEAAGWTVAMVHNVNPPGVIISPAADMAITPENAERVKSTFSARFSGERRGEPLVMGAATKVDVLSYSPEQMKLTEIRRVPEERITAYLGIPAIVVGMGAGLDRSTFANFSEAREAAYESCLIPTQRLFAADLNAQLVPEFGDPKKLRLSFDLSEVRVLQDDQNAKAARMEVLLRSGGLMIDEFRVEMGYDALPNGAGQVLLLPGAWAPTPPAHLAALAAAPAPEPGPAPPQAGGGAAPDQPPADDQQPPPAKTLTFTTLKALSDAEIVARYEAGLAPLTETLANDLLDAFEAIADTAAGRLTGLQLPTNGKANGHATAVLDLKAVEAIGGLVTEADHAEIRSLLRSYVLKAMRQAAEDLAPLTDGPVRIQRNNPAVRRAIAEMEARLPGMIETTGEDFGRLVRRLERRPGSVPLADIQQALRDYVAESYPSRADMIARTELNYGHAAGVLLVAEKSGIADRVHVHDGDHSDAICASRNGSVISLEEAHGIGLAHPRCQLRLVPVLEAP